MRSIRPVIFWLHLSLGSVAGIVILVMSVTGVLLAYERQINARVDAPALFQEKTDTTPRLQLDAVVTALSVSGQGVPDQLVLHNDPSAPVEARYGRERSLFLNPWTAEVIGQPSQQARAFFSTIERIHRSLGLGMQSAFGRGITGSGNLIFLGLLLSGLYLWLPKIFNAASLKHRILFRRNLFGRPREWNWHHVFGIWSAIPLLFIVVTGVIMSYPWASNLLFTMTGSQPPVRGFRGAPRAHHAPIDSASPAPQFHSLDEIALLAKQKIPAWNSITLDIPDPQDRIVSLSVDTSIGGQPEKSTQLTVNRQSAHIDAIRRFSDNSLGQRLRAFARFTHTGEEFGVLGETIAALASIGAIMLVWTGLSMALRRARTALTGSRADAERELIAR